MPKKQSKKKSSSRKKPAKPNRPKVLANNASPRPVRARRNPSMGHVSAVCSITDPFCPASKNSKWPDGTNGNTLTEQFRGMTTITTDANGQALATFQPGCPYGYMKATMSGGVGTFPSTLTQYKANSMYSTYGAYWRIVSFGCIVRCVASATTASGLVTLGTSIAVTPGTAITLGQELYDQVVVKAIQPGMEVSWISQPRGPTARAFGAASTDSGLNNSSFTAMTLEITGAAASSSPINVEWFLNVEFTALAHNRALTSIARPNPPEVPAATSAVSRVHSSLGSFIEGGVSVVEDAIAKAANSALKAVVDDPLTSLASLFGML